MPKVDLLTLDGAKVNQARRAQFLTLPELSERARCSPKIVWKAHAGRPISLARAKAVAAALKVPIESLVAKVAADGCEKPQAVATVGVA